MLIDAEPLIRRYARKMRLALEDGYPKTASDYASRIKDLMQAPEAVVHCKDCEYWSVSACGRDAHYCRIIDPGDSPDGCDFAEHDFCSFGKRKEESK